MEPEAPRRGRPTWQYIGCTCGALVVLAFGALALLTWFAYREAKSVKQSYKDPASRAAKTREVLQYDSLPEGYYALGSFSVPLIAQMAFFGDQEPKSGDEPSDSMRERGFIYMNLRQMRDNKRDILRYVKGEAPEKRPEWMNANADFQTGDPISRGKVDVQGTTVYYFASRGAIRQPKQRMGGLLTLAFMECKDDPRVRFGVWLGPDPDPDKPVAELDTKGTTADPEALKKFLGHFRICPQG